MRRAAFLLALVAAAQGPRNEPVAEQRYAAVFHVSRSGDDERGDGSARRPWQTIRRALEKARGASRERRYAV
ncbi:MAG: hypothetical protein ACP5U2_18210, partial [Bryobacteraceae bacterium]